MLANKLLNRARDLRELAEKGQPLPADACKLLSVILEDLGERVAAIETLPVPPGATNVVHMHAFQRGAA